MLLKRIFYIVCVFYTLNSYSQTNSKDMYEFPVRGHEEWWQLTVEQRIAALQIPDVVLENISTERFAIHCIINFRYIAINKKIFHKKDSNHLDIPII